MKKVLPFTRSSVYRIVFPILAPLLFGMYPVLHYYTRNVELVLLPSLLRMLGLYFVVILIIYGIALLFCRFDGIKAALASSVFLLFVNTYGIVFDFLLTNDLIKIKHYTLLPVYALAGFYLAWLATRLRKDIALTAWRVVTVIFLGFSVYNIARIIPAEINKARLQHVDTPVAAPVQTSPDGTYPDIYYLVFDEFAGFKPMREYWHTPEVDPFVAMLKEKGFFVAEDSHSSGTSTLHQMSIRLNYTEYPDIPDQSETYYKAIAYNKVMALAKSRGYTTVAFDEISWSYQAIPTIQADYLYELDPKETSNLGLIFDDFGMLITDKTMVYAFSDLYKLENFGYTPHRNMLIFTSERLADMSDIPSPKFIYSHLMIPHRPYLYDRDGKELYPDNYRDWDYYEGYWAYSLGLIEEMVDHILEDADPENPPVIILQSDHGARYRVSSYPKEYLTSILFAMYLPGYDYSKIPQDVNPVNTFPIVFNHYLGENIPLQ